MLRISGITVVILVSAFLTQAPQRTTAERVYTETQAARGEELVLKVGCANCHGEDLDGGADETPPLWGQEFLSQWTGATLKDLHVKVTDMPPDSSTKRTPQEQTDIVAFLLHINGYPAGGNELSADQALLAQICIVAP
jgi:mono/diheme cytochrome c family protein